MTLLDALGRRVPSIVPLVLVKPRSPEFDPSATRDAVALRSWVLRHYFRAFIAKLVAVAAILIVLNLRHTDRWVLTFGLGALCMLLVELYTWYRMLHAPSVIAKATSLRRCPSCWFPLVPAPVDDTQTGSFVKCSDCGATWALGSSDAVSGDPPSSPPT